VEDGGRRTLKHRGARRLRDPGSGREIQTELCTDLCMNCTRPGLDDHSCPGKENFDLEMDISKHIFPLFDFKSELNSGLCKSSSSIVDDGQVET
jgi:hypothetical protein